MVAFQPFDRCRRANMTADLLQEALQQRLRAPDHDAVPRGTGAFPGV